MELELKKQISEQLVLLSQQQSKLSKEHKGVVVLVEGMGETGKASIINKMISVINPKYYNVEIMNTEDYTDRVPFTTKYFCKLPEYGAFTFFDSGWYTEVARKALNDKKFNFDQAIKDIRYLEKSIIDNGYVLVKLFLSIDKKDQSKRIKKLLSNEDTAWKVSNIDIWEHKNFKKLSDNYDKLIDCSYDTLVLGSYRHRDMKMLTIYQAIKYINDYIDISLDTNEEVAKLPERNSIENNYVHRIEVNQVSDDEYKENLISLQKELSRIQDKMYQRGIATVIAFEGLDAAGKGGAIKRLSKTLDPRNFKIHPIAAPTKEEKNRHFLYRFWNMIPKSGHIAIFDRTWYGRVLVERIEGFCRYNEYVKAYEEINNFESYLLNNNVLLIKFWIDIDKEEQLNRFNARKTNPKKAWKLTEEDWRNREKWDEYEKATKDMFLYTSNKNTGWYIINGNNKKNARIAVLKTVISEMKNVLNI